MSVAIPTARLIRHCHPFRAQPWGVPVGRKDVTAALKSGRLVDVPGTDDHAGRIAFLVKHPSAEPIDIDVGVPALGCHVEWMVLDGNHRLAAAIYTRSPSILANVSGQLNYAQELFGVDCADASG